MNKKEKAKNLIIAQGLLTAIERVKQSLNQHKGVVVERFEKVKGDISEIWEAITGLDKRIDKNESNIEAISTDIEKIDSDIEDLGVEIGNKHSDALEGIKSAREYTDGMLPILDEIKGEISETRRDFLEGDKELDSKVDRLDSEVNSWGESLARSIESLPIQKIKDSISELALGTKEKIVDVKESIGKELTKLSKRITNTESDIKELRQDIVDVDIEPGDVRDKLESLKGRNRLDAKAIKNLPASIIQGGGGGGSSTFVGLTDTPSTYNNQRGKVAIVNQAETGLVFDDYEAGESSAFDGLFSSTLMWGTTYNLGFSDDKFIDIIYNGGNSNGG